MTRAVSIGSFPVRPEQSGASPRPKSRFDIVRGRHPALVEWVKPTGSGVNVGFGDGSVKFVKDSVNLPTWRALGTRSGGEIVGADSY